MTVTRKGLIAAAATVLFFMMSAGCGTQLKTNAPANVRAAADTNAAKPSEKTILDQNYRLIREEKESQIFMIMDAKHGDNGYIVKIFNNEKKVIYETKVLKVNNYEPWTKMVDDDTVQIRQGRGSGFWVCFYYDRKNHRVSQVYHNPLLAGNGKVVFPIGGKTASHNLFSGLAVSDIFDKNAFYKEFVIEDLAPSFTVFKELKWIGVNRLSVTYMTGKTRDESKEKTIVFELNE